MYFRKPIHSELFQINFQYPAESGYLFKQSERKTLAAAVKNTSGLDLDLFMCVWIVRMDGAKVYADERHLAVKADDTAAFTFDFETDRLGYYDVFCQARWSEIWMTERTGLGVIRDCVPSDSPESPFGLCCNFWFPDRMLPLLKRMGAKHLRMGQNEPRALNGALEQYGFLAMCQQVGGDVENLDSRFAPPLRNASYHYTKQNPQVLLQEHGNECWEEHDLTQLTEWTKISHLAKMTANPNGFYSMSGMAGSDVHRYEHFFRQGGRAYVSYLGIHPYTFPKAPELDGSFWSFERLRALAELNDRYGALPVVASEQGYPAMDDQPVCEAYSPEDMVTKAAQADYLVRKYVLLLSFGVSKILWFNGPWYNGFGLLERDNLSPWPAAVAFCELTRRLCEANYVGDLVPGDGAYVKVFERAGQPVAVAWRPVLKSRSFDSTLNYTLDGLHRECDGVGLEPVRFQLPFASGDTVALDIFGHPVTTEITDGRFGVLLGESPVYIEGLDSAVLAEAAKHSCVLFPPMKMGVPMDMGDTPTPLPPNIILGIQDKEPIRGAYHSAEIFPGERRTLLVRVHNFSDQPLESCVTLRLPDDLTAAPDGMDFTAQPNETVTLAFALCAGDGIQAGEREVWAELPDRPDVPAVLQYYRVGCPLSIAPIEAAAGAIRALTVNCYNPGDEPRRYTISGRADGLVFDRPATLTVPARSVEAVPLPVHAATAVIGTTVQLTLETDNANGQVGRGEYTTTLPLYHIPRLAQWTAEAVQPLVIAGPWTPLSVIKDRTGPELMGDAKPDSTLLATAQLAIVGDRLTVKVEVEDDDLVLVQNTRRSNMDCDGVWFELYGEGDKPAYRFCMAPSDPSGRAENATIREFASDIPWETPYSDYDLSRLDYTAQLWPGDAERPKGYTLTLSIPLDSVGLTADMTALSAGFRVIDMDRVDWPQFYDTGKLTFCIG